MCARQCLKSLPHLFVLVSYMCMCKCMCVRMYCMYICMYEGVVFSLSVQEYVRMCVCTYTCPRDFVLYMHVYVYLYDMQFLCTNTHRLTDSHSHTHTHTIKKDTCMHLCANMLYEVPIRQGPEVTCDSLIARLITCNCCVDGVLKY
jgi:hypothetical protein